MKVITQIYLNCRPDLRDDWLTASEVDDVNEIIGQEHALRGLVKYCQRNSFLNRQVLTYYIMQIILPATVSALCSRLLVIEGQQA